MNGTSFNEALTMNVRKDIACTPEDLGTLYSIPADKVIRGLLKFPIIIEMPDIKKVIFNDPATIVLWSDSSKTVVKAHDEKFDPEKGLAMAIAKRALSNNCGCYYETFKKWLPKEKKTPREGSVMTVKEYCMEHNLTKNRVYEMINRGEIKARKDIKTNKWLIYGD